MKYKVDRNEPLPTGEPIEKLPEEEINQTRLTISATLSLAYSCYHPFHITHDNRRYRLYRLKHVKNQESTIIVWHSLHTPIRSRVEFAKPTVFETILSLLLED